MPSTIYLMLRSAPFETPTAAAPQDKRAHLEARTTSMLALVRCFPQFFHTLFYRKA